MQTDCFNSSNMADRVHPVSNSPPRHDSQLAKFAPSSPDQLGSPPPGTVVIQVPKDTIYRIPPPENARRFKEYTSRKDRRSFCCRFLCCLISTLLLVVLLAGIAAGIFYLVVKPKAMSYSIDSVAVSGFNLSQNSVSPEFDVSVRSDNPNSKISVYYKAGSAVDLYYSGTKLCDGVLPVFYQPVKNVTVFQTALKGSGIVLGSTLQKALVDEQSKGNIPLTLNLKVPVKIKVGSITTWKITVKVNCDVNVDKLTSDAKIVKKDCNFGVKLW